MMELVEDFIEKSYNINGNPWKCEGFCVRSPIFSYFLNFLHVSFCFFNFLSCFFMFLHVSSVFLHFSSLMLIFSCFFFFVFPFFFVFMFSLFLFVLSFFFVCFLFCLFLCLFFCGTLPGGKDRRHCCVHLQAVEGCGVSSVIKTRHHDLHLFLACRMFPLSRAR